MLAKFTVAALVLGFQLAEAAPVYFPRTVTSLDQSQIAEAQPRDDTATRAFTAAPIKTSDGQCLTVDKLGGDARENLIPITAAACDGSAGQQWDVITNGKHANQPGFANFVSTLTNGCMNFDDRRAPGNQVLLFSCGGRADGGGDVVNSQLFTFANGAGAAPLPLVPQSGNNASCFAVKNGALDVSACDPTKPAADQLFTIGASGKAAAPDSASASASATASATATTSAKASAKASKKGSKASATASDSASSSASATASTSVAAKANNAQVTPAPSSTTASATATTPDAVSRAGGVLNPSAAAEANPKDNTATRAFTGAAVKTSDGKCLSIDPAAGDFRENLIPVTIADCDGSDGQKFDVITKGVHQDAQGQALIVSSETNGCLNFDPRRAAGDQVILFSCGGRADGGGAVTNSQQFAFTGGNGPLPLTPNNAAGTCLVNNGGKLDSAPCDKSDAQNFTFA